MEQPPNGKLLYWPARDAADNPVAILRDDAFAALCGDEEFCWFAPNDAAEPMCWTRLEAEFAAGGLRLEDAIQLDTCRPEPAREWTFNLTAPAPWVNSNEQRSGKKPWPEQAGAIKDWRDTGKTCAIAAGLRRPRVRLDTVEVHVVVRFPDDSTIRDAPNVYPSIKAVVDGALVDTGVLPDDSDRHLACLCIRPGPPIPVRPYQPAGELQLTIREVLP